jgi:bis(5'-nucleosyl)-tetraphosphatase (symmetrical)
VATYVIGDIQGCYYSLQQLLQKINFNSTTDRLWFTGDLVNRGANSLAVLRFVRDLGNKQRTVLGNHDLHLLVCAYNKRYLTTTDTLSTVLSAKDCADLIDWLRHQHLVYHDSQLGYTLVHAGLAPQWTLATALNLAQEVTTKLRSKQINSFLANIYGNKPDNWHDKLQGWARLRAIVNYCTRMRYCCQDGSLELGKTKPGAPINWQLCPWFKHPARVNSELEIVFGHWSCLAGITNVANVHALDTGCVWGLHLTAMRLEDKQRFTVACDPADLINH